MVSPARPSAPNTRSRGAEAPSQAPKGRHPDGEGSRRADHATHDRRRRRRPDRRGARGGAGQRPRAPRGSGADPARVPTAASCAVGRSRRCGRLRQAVGHVKAPTDRPVATSGSLAERGVLAQLAGLELARARSRRRRGDAVDLGPARDRPCIACAGRRPISPRSPRPGAWRWPGCTPNVARDRRAAAPRPWVLGAAGPRWPPRPVAA